MEGHLFSCEGQIGTGCIVGSVEKVGDVAVHETGPSTHFVIDVPNSCARPPRLTVFAAGDRPPALTPSPSQKGFEGLRPTLYERRIDCSNRIALGFRTAAARCGQQVVRFFELP